MAEGRVVTQAVATTSSELVGEQIARLRDIFPEAVREGKVDWDALRATLGDELDSKAERYTFSWSGRKDATRVLQTPSNARLVPLPDESVNWGKTRNVFVDGDNLETLKLIHKAYAGRVKCIYIDPPYNTGRDFVYPDNFADPLDTYLRMTGQRGEKGEPLTTNQETDGRFHSRWLSMMLPRLFLARQLLRQDGVIFVSIDDHEVHHLRIIMNDVFGEDNFVGMLAWQSKKGGGSDKGSLVNDQEYVMCYSVSTEGATLHRTEIEAEDLDRTDAKGAYRRGRELNKWGANSRREDRPTMWFAVKGPNGEKVFPIRNDGAEGCWRWGTKKMHALVDRGDAEFVPRGDGTFIVYEKIRSTDPRFKPYRTWMTDVGTTADGSKEVKGLFDGKKVFDFPKPTALVKHLVGIGTDGEEDDIVMDFFAGSGTTAQAVIEKNAEDDGKRIFFLVQVPEPFPETAEARKAGFETLSQLAVERIRRTIKAQGKPAAGKLPVESRGEPAALLGFNLFRMATSNFAQWTGAESKEPAALMKQMELQAKEPLVKGWKPEEVIWEVAVKEGYSLNTVLAKQAVEGATVWKVSDPETGQSFLICLDGMLKDTIVRDMTLTKTDLFICRDSALNDTLAANLALQCRLKTI